VLQNVLAGRYRPLAVAELQQHLLSLPLQLRVGWVLQQVQTDNEHN
jgi:hypothetical protein